MKQRIIYILALLFATMQASAQTYTYDSNYRLTEVKYGNGITVTYTYDALGNRLTKKVTGGVVKGDANGDKRVSITDAVGIVNYILGNTSASSYNVAADVNSDGQITITDAVGVVNIILNGDSGASAPKLEVPQDENAPAGETPEATEPE